MDPATSAVTGAGTAAILVFVWNDLLTAYLHAHGVAWFPQMSAVLATILSPTFFLLIHQIWGDWRTIVDRKLGVTVNDRNV
jgi:hypothetical protein